MSQGFVHLRVRSAYSLLEGAVKAGKLGKLAADAQMPAIGIADRANLFGALEFSQACKDAGVQPIVGCAIPVVSIGGKRAGDGTTRWRPALRPSNGLRNRKDLSGSKTGRS